MLNMNELMSLISQTLAKSANCSVLKEDALHNTCSGNCDGFLSQQIKLIKKALQLPKTEKIQPIKLKQVIAMFEMALATQSTLPFFTMFFFFFNSVLCFSEVSILQMI